MTHPELEAQIAAATAYEEFFVPALFREWGPRLVAAAGLGPGHAALDVACGTGVLARAAADVVGPGGSVTGLDLNPGMLAVAGRLAPRVRWEQGDAGGLPFPDAAFHAVMCQFGLMFFPDRAEAIREMWRVLRPGGSMAVAVWASLDDTPAYAAEVALLERLAGRAAADALRAPFVLGDRSVLQAIFLRAEIPRCRIETITGRARFPSIRAMVETDIRGWLPLMGVTLAEPVILEVLEEADRVLNPYLSADGAVEFDSPAHVVSATKAN